MNTAHLSSALRSAVSALHKGLRKRMYSVHSYSMTEIETIGLLVRHSSLSPTELAALTRIRTQSMSQILNKMEEQGIVKKMPSRKDGRKVHITLTPRGKRLVEKTQYDRDEWLKGVIEKSLTAKEKELLVKAVPVLNKLASAK